MSVKQWCEISNCFRLGAAFILFFSTQLEAVLAPFCSVEKNKIIIIIVIIIIILILLFNNNK